MNNLRV